MPTILQVAGEYRKRLFQSEGETGRDIVRAYTQSYQTIESDLQRLLDLIQEQRKSGKPVTSSWLHREQRYKDLLTQIEFQVGRFGDQAVQLVTSGQGRAVELAHSGSQEMVAAAQREVAAKIAMTWNRVPVEALENLVGFMQDGSPLKDLFDQLGPKAAAKAKDVLTHAVIAGNNPRQTARQMKDAFGGSLSRALTVARTEQMRSYRQASIDNYRANDDVVDGWTRIETLDDLTCVICIAECGKVYTNKDDFETHPNCRGTLVPNVKGVERPNVPNGNEWFNKQPEDKQREILGDKKFEAYKKGEIDLNSLVQRTYDEKWGGGRRERSLDDAKEAFQSRRSDNRTPEETVSTWRTTHSNEGLTLKDQYWRDTPEGRVEGNLENQVQRTTQREYEKLEWYRQTKDLTEAPKNAKKEEVLFKDLLSPQTSVEKQTVLEYVKNIDTKEFGKSWAEGPRVLEIEGQKYLIDGTHRVNAAMALGHEQAPMSVVKVEDLPSLPKFLINDRLPAYPP